METAVAQPGRGGEQQIFPASRLWLGTLGVVIVCAGLALALIIGTGSSGALCLLFIAAAIFGPASVLFYAARREVVLDDEGVLVRTPKGTTALELPWQEIADAKYELSPSGRYNQVRMTLTDGSEKLITEHQVRKLPLIGTAIDERRKARG